MSQDARAGCVRCQACSALSTFERAFGGGRDRPAGGRVGVGAGMSALDVRVALADEDVAAHHRVRREVFVREQRIFAEDDRDGWDEDAVKVVALLGGRVLGAVRLYPLDEAGLWKGDRLAVLPEGRRLRIGAPLVRFAVATAGRRGGTRMIALIQARNVPFFRQLGWSALGDETDYRGATHQEMTIAPAGAEASSRPAATPGPSGGPGGCRLRRPPAPASPRCPAVPCRRRGDRRSGGRASLASPRRALISNVS